MKRNIRHIIYILVPAILLLLSVSCAREEDDLLVPEPVVSGAKGQTLDFTLIVYMAAENSLYGMVQEDLNEIMQGMEQLPEGTRVVAYVDDARSSRLYAGCARQEFQNVKSYDENICSTSEEGMTRVLTDILQDYPADHYALVLWSHGSGWVIQHSTSAATKASGHLRSIGIDNGQRGTSNEGSVMDIPVLARVLSNFPHMSYILFDACFMQCVEVAYELRHLTDYVIASPAEIPDPGAPYHRLLPMLCRVPANMSDIVNTYVDYYENLEAGFPYVGVELSAIRTDALENLAAVTAPYLKSLLAARAEYDASAVQRYYYGLSFTKYTEFFDFKNWFYQALSADDYAAWCQAYDAAVPVVRLTPQWFSGIPSRQTRSVADIDHSGGVSVFVPSGKYEQNGWVNNYHSLQWYDDTKLQETGW